jgi:hypothetical protein
VPVVNPFDCLFKADRDEEADDDSGDVNEEAFPGVHRFLRGVNFEHRH